MGDQRDDASAPNGIPPHRIVNLINLDVLYGISNRLNVDLTVPFAIGSAIVGDASHQLHQYSASGLGDVSLQAEYWLSDPALPSRVTGSVGVGFLAPTGRDDVTYTPDPGSGPVPVDESAQLGTGGWAILLRAQGTAQIHGPFFAYASGYYGLSLQEHTDVRNFVEFRAVPDTYSGRLGGAWLISGLEGLVVSLGGRINGVTVGDIIGGEDQYWRRPGYEVYVEPGLTWTLPASMVTLSVPVRVYANKLNAPRDRLPENGPIGASFAPYLLLASYARRF